MAFLPFSLLLKSHRIDLQLGSALAINSRLAVSSSFHESLNPLAAWCWISFGAWRLLFSLLFMSPRIGFVERGEGSETMKLAVFSSFLESLNRRRSHTAFANLEKLSVFSSFSESLKHTELYGQILPSGWELLFSNPFWSH